MLPRFPTKWSQSELAAARSLAESRFVLERRGEGPDAFYATCESLEPQVASTLDLTKDLEQITGAVLVSHPLLWQRLRYFCAPPISEEDLWTLVGKKFKSVSTLNSAKTAEALSSVLDARRFPWVAAARKPTDVEREIAIRTTTVLWAHETLKTSRRGVSSRAQEVAVSDALTQSGFAKDPSRTPILRLDQLERGSFSRERKVDGAKCDVPIRLLDGRLLALECKVSNGPKNSWKRLQREVGGKAERWKQEFGSQVVTGAVLAGVFDLKCLLNAQDDQNVFLFWEHELSGLIKFVKETI